MTPHATTTLSQHSEAPPRLEPPNLRRLRKVKEEAYRSGDRDLFRQTRNTLNREVRKPRRCYGENLKRHLSANPDPSTVWKEAAPALQVREEEVRQMFRRQKTRKAPGPDGVSPSCLKVCAEQLAPTFARIFNRSLELCEVPSCFKSSTIVPVANKPAITGRSLGDKTSRCQRETAKNPAKDDRQG
ncbi:uncharacterized protein ACBT44_000744 [Syngnathus typhle]